jgi:YbbR domain-containing protein
VRYPSRPVSARNAAAARRVFVQPVEAAVSVRAPRRVHDSLRDNPLDVYVDVAGLGPGRHTLPVRVEPRDGCVVTAIEPASATVRIQ